MIQRQWRLFRLRLHDRTFWIVQGLVIVITIGHTGLETEHVLRHAPDLYLLPVSTYFIPVVYAGLNFGLEGAVPTALWCVLLALPNLFLFHRGYERIGVAVQLAILMVVGAVIAYRVDAERRAKLDAVAANRELAEAQRSLEGYLAMAMRAQEDERARLARELHDQTIQDLLVVKAALEQVPKVDDRGSPLQAIDDGLQGAIEGIRRLAVALRPSVLDDLGLAPTLQWLLSDLATRSGIVPSFNASGDRTRLDTDAELAIFRIAQEALHNVERHAQATTVALSLVLENHRLHLEIVDDGRGFDPHHVRPGGLGLAGMHERARLIGAELKILSRPGSTTVSVDLPYREPGASGSPPADSQVLQSRPVRK